MAKLSSVQKNLFRQKLIKKYKSKRDSLKAKIKNKNIIDLGGMPLVEHTFKFVSNLKVIHKLALSSDSKKIIEICSKYKKIEVPFVRPEELSSDSANISDVSLHILEHYKKEKFTHLALFQPTTPFRNIDDISNAIDFFKNRNIESIFSVKVNTISEWSAHSNSCYNHPSHISNFVIFLYVQLHL
mgnify:CR=1 FL=1